MSIEEIQTWKTTDGEIFERLLDAELHEGETVIRDAVGAFWREHGYSGMNVSDVIDFCLQYRSQLQEALGKQI